MKYAIVREQPNKDYDPEADPPELATVFEPTGEVYDDKNGPIMDHLAELQEKTGACHGADAQG
jgi:uncharacterized protein involved in type VI secretion and phage assembly